LEPWWIAKIKPRQEKALAEDFLEKSVEYYLPMFTKVTRRKDNNKPRKSILCLFPGYISFSVARGEEYQLYATNRIVKILEIKNQNRFIRELDQVYHTLDLGINLEPFKGHHPDFTPGTLVEVTTGPMRGVQGVIVKINSGHKLILSVDVLGKAAVNIDAAMVRQVHG
jgi:transcription antitermination factor NusG